MIAPSTLHASSLYFLFIPYFFKDKLTVLLLTSCFSSSPLHSLIQATILSLTLTLVILLLLLELSGDEVRVEEFLLPLGWVRTEVFVMCHGLAEARSDTVEDDVDQVVVDHLSIDIKSIDIIQVFWTVPVCLRSLTLLKALSGL